MLLLHIYCVLIFFLDGSNGDAIKNTNTVLSGKQNNIPSVSSRFFDLSGILGQLFPGFNQGIQQGSGRNPGGIGFPSNSQFYPEGGATQASKPSSSGRGHEGGSWPVLDDASQYPYRGQKPGNNFGTGIQNPNYNNPSQVNGGYPHIHNPGQFNFGQLPQGQGPKQNVNIWNPGGGGSQNPNVYPWNPGNTGQNPLNVFPWTPGNQGIGQDPHENLYPGTSVNPGNIGSPVQGGLWNQNPGQIFGPGSGHDGDGTLDALVPPQPEIPDDYPQPEPGTFENSNNNGQPGQDQQSSGNDSGKNAILGRPVVVPTDKTPEETIFFPKSTENPLQRQCVQDCRTSSEYSPVCGTDNVTYFNPGRFICARNCGINVFVLRQGRCDRN